MIEDLVFILLQVNPEDRPSSSQLLKAPTLQLHIRSYLLRAKNNSRSKSEEKLNLVSEERCFDLKRSPKENLKNNYLPSRIRSHPSTESITSQLQTDSAYTSENEFHGDMYPVLYERKANTTSITDDDTFEKSKNGKWQQITDLVEKQDAKIPKIEAENDIKKSKPDEIAPKRSSYIEPIASTDQSFTTNFLNNTYNVSKDLNNITEVSAKKRVGNMTRRRSNDLSPGKKNKEVKLRRRSYEVEINNSKPKLPRRLSVDSIGDKDQNTTTKAQDTKTRQKSSLSTLKKFIRRNSKSSEPVETHWNLATNQTAPPSDLTTNPLSPPNPRDKKHLKKTKTIPNFIERNKKLLAGKKTTATDRSKLSSLEEVSESPLAKIKEPVENSKVMSQHKTNEKTPSKTRRTDLKIRKAAPRNCVKSNIQKGDNSHLQSPLFRKRSVTFDTKEAFFKFGRKGSKQSSTEFDCIDACTKSEVCNIA